MELREEKDSMGTVKVPKNVYWGAQTERSRRNFQVGTEKIPVEIIRAFALIKKACASVNERLGGLSKTKSELIQSICDEILMGNLSENFPLAVWQTGSGTQTNMNVNEVICHRAKEIAPDIVLHPNDDVNRSQSSNDTFPTAMHVSAVVEIRENLLPELEKTIEALEILRKKYHLLVKIGRTHLQDAVPMTFGQEISGWMGMLKAGRQAIQTSLPPLEQIALGATAVGTGLNAPEGFAEKAAQELSALTGHSFYSEENKFHALSGQDAMVFAHGALKALAADWMKIANDIRWLASGPRCGIGEIHIPENEPGSSIMPGKVNPTQCESATMVAAQVLANDVAVGFGASQGNFELNVFMPLIAYNFLQSVRLLTDSLHSFRENCIRGIRPDEERMSEYVSRSLMLVTALSSHIGYDAAAEIAAFAHNHNMMLKEAAEATGYVSGEQYDQWVIPMDMTHSDQEMPSEERKPADGMKPSEGQKPVNGQRDISCGSESLSGSVHALHGGSDTLSGICGTLPYDFESLSRDDERSEEDFIGQVYIPKSVYYGAQTARAKENFPITGELVEPEMNYSIAKIKKACAIANGMTGGLPTAIEAAVIRAADEVIAGKFDQDFVTDPIQGGAGTSMHMNVNEVIANRASELMGEKVGSYAVHPNDHVNKAQSTNDVIPTAGKLTVMILSENLLHSMRKLRDSFAKKAEEFQDDIKVGRTHLQDAVPISMGQVFHAYASSIQGDIGYLQETLKECLKINIGATAVGTGINTVEGFRETAVQALSEISGYSFYSAADLVDGTRNISVFAHVSSTLKNFALNLSRICNDLRLMASGPKAGFSEIFLPQKQCGSTIMPGKVNPVIPEAINQICFQVGGNDATISAAVEAGQMELNVFEPVIFYDLFLSIKLLTRACQMLREKCVQDIQVNRKQIQSVSAHSLCMVTNLVPLIGYDKAAEISKRALQNQSSLLEELEKEAENPDFPDRVQLLQALQPKTALHPQAEARSDAAKHPDKAGYQRRHS